MGDRGLTLTELLVALALLSCICVGAMAFFQAGIHGWEEGMIRSELQQHARIAAEELANELTWADMVRVNRETREIMYTKKASGTEGQYRFYLLQKQLMLQLPEGVSVPVASCIEDLGLEPDGKVNAGSVVTIVVYGSDGESTVRFRLKVKPRNL